MLKETRILVVEDDPAVARSLTDALEREAYLVEWRNTAASAVTEARENNPHLVLLDVRLPDGSGFDVCRQMREDGLRMPVIILTVQDDEVDKVVGLEVGADDYLTKPYRLRELLARVRAQLRRAYGSLAATGADVLYAGDLVIDRSRGTVTRRDEDIVLTPTEFRLLVHFAQHPGQVFGRDQLLEAVWGYSADVSDEKTVNVHIRRLREKIERDPAEPELIATVRGLGYKLNN
ncbi:MAG: response regulator transcription factor [Coriobacteriia bacterium]|nr:response regulator transcription factor [Coriobacteriia bacterium]